MPKVINCIIIVIIALEGIKKQKQKKKWQQNSLNITRVDEYAKIHFYPPK